MVSTVYVRILFITNVSFITNFGNTNILKLWNFYLDFQSIWIQMECDVTKVLNIWFHNSLFNVYWPKRCVWENSPYSCLFLYPSIYVYKMSECEAGATTGNSDTSTYATRPADSGKADIQAPGKMYTEMEKHPCSVSRLDFWYSCGKEGVLMSASFARNMPWESGITLPSKGKNA